MARAFQQTADATMGGEIVPTRGSIGPARLRRPRGLVQRDGQGDLDVDGSGRPGTPCEALWGAPVAGRIGAKVVGQKARSGGVHTIPYRAMVASANDRRTDR